MPPFDPSTRLVGGLKSCRSGLRASGRVFDREQGGTKAWNNGILEYWNGGEAGREAPGVELNALLMPNECQMTKAKNRKQLKEKPFFPQIISINTDYNTNKIILRICEIRLMRMNLWIKESIEAKYA